MGIRAKRLKQHNKWTSTINESKDKYALSVIKIANSLVRQGKTLETSKELEELFLLFSLLYYFFSFKISFLVD